MLCAAKQLFHNMSENKLYGFVADNVFLTGIYCKLKAHLSEDSEIDDTLQNYAFTIRQYYMSPKMWLIITW